MGFCQWHHWLPARVRCQWCEHETKLGLWAPLDRSSTMLSTCLINGLPQSFQNVNPILVGAPASMLTCERSKSLAAGRRRSATLRCQRSRDLLYPNRRLVDCTAHLPAVTAHISPGVKISPSCNCVICMGPTCPCVHLCTSMSCKRRVDPSLEEPDASPPDAVQPRWGPHWGPNILSPDLRVARGRMHMHAHVSPNLNSSMIAAGRTRPGAAPLQVAALSGQVCHSKDKLRKWCI